MEDAESMKEAFHKILRRLGITELLVVGVIVGLGIWRVWKIQDYGSAFFFAGLFEIMAMGLTLGADRPGAWVGGSMFINLQRVVTKQEVDPEAKEQVEGFLNAYRTPIFLFLAGIITVWIGIFIQIFFP